MLFVTLSIAIPHHAAGRPVNVTVDLYLASFDNIHEDLMVRISLYDCGLPALYFKNTI